MERFSRRHLSGFALSQVGTFAARAVDWRVLFVSRTAVCVGCPLLFAAVSVFRHLCRVFCVLVMVASKTNPRAVGYGGTRCYCRLSRYRGRIRSVLGVC